MRIVLDTNVLVAAFISRGACGELLEYCALNHVLVLSQAILDEFRRTLTAKFGFDRTVVEDAVGLLRTRCRIAEVDQLPQPICRDPDDDLILATAVAGACNCIVTGDADLLELGSFQDVAIVSPQGFWTFEREHGQ